MNDKQLDQSYTAIKCLRKDSSQHNLAKKSLWGDGATWSDLSELSQETDKGEEVKIKVSLYQGSACKLCPDI